MSRHPSLEVFGLDMRRTAVLTTSSDNHETEKLNGISTFSFKVPKSDTKIEYLKKRRFVRYDDGEAYRIIDIADVKNAVGYKQASCEHALATLADDVMFQDHVVGNSGQDTAFVINYILSFQRVRRWVLARCDFSYFYEYGWSSENLLNAIFSVAKPFVDLYKFETNTHVYPYELSLVRINPQAKPQFHVFERLNFLEEHRKEESGEVFTRLYGLGAGEGVNQVTISEVNGGVPYLDAPQSAIDEFGLISGVFIGREYDSPSTLKAIMEATLNEVCQPLVSSSVKAADLHEINRRDLLLARIGDVIQLSDGYRTYITEKSKNHDEPGNMTLGISNKTKDVASSLAALADRQRIESTYAQGATQLWANTTIDNASPSDGSVHPIWMPHDAKIVNSVMVKIEVSKFRAYSKTTAVGGQATRSSAEGGGGSTTSENATQGVTATTLFAMDYGGTETWSCQSAGSHGHSIGPTHSSGASNQLNTGTTSNHYHKYYGYTGHTHGNPSTNDAGSHTHAMRRHYHIVYVETGPHKHNVTFTKHSHEFTTPEHSHPIEYGIFYASENPTSAMVYVNGSYVFSIGTSYEGDITQYLIGNDGKIPRGRYINLKVVPNALARITISSAPQAFIQSKTGGRY